MAEDLKKDIGALSEKVDAVITHSIDVSKIVIDVY
jgi:hypothetical protein